MKKLRLGTGAIVAAAFIGPGTVTVCSSAGAQFGYELLWVLLFSVFATIILQEMVVRLSLSTGSDLASVLRKSLTSKISKVIISILVVLAIYIGSVAYESGNIAGAASAIEGVFGPLSLSVGSSSISLYGVIIGLAAIAILSTGKYKLIENTLIGLVILMSIVFVTTAIVIGPDLGEILSGLFLPSIPGGSGFMIVGLLGTTVVPYNLFLQSSALLSNSNRSTYQEAKTETAFSIGIGGLISMAIVIASSAVFFSSGITLSKVSDLALQLEPLLGSWSGPFMTIGFFAAGISSALTAPLAAAYTVFGVLGWQGGLKDKKFIGIWLSAIVIGVFFYSSGIRPIQLIIIAQAANGLLLPVLGIILLWLMNRGDMLGESKNKLISNVLGFIVVGIVTILGAKTVLSLLGVI